MKPTGQVKPYRRQRLSSTKASFLSQRRTRKPNWPSILVETMSMTVTCGLSTMQVTTAADISRLLLIRVPGASLRLAAPSLVSPHVR